MTTMAGRGPGGDAEEIQQHDGAQHADEATTRMRFWVTAVLALFVAFLFFRSVLPRIPRLFLRGRLRVKRMGIRGIRGVQWHSDGFSSSGDGTDKHQSGDSGDSRHAGFQLKVGRIYLSLRWKRNRDERRRHAERTEPSQDGFENANLSEEERRQLQQRRSRQRAWVTLHIDGVGVRLPPKSAASEAYQREKREKKRRQLQEQRKMADAEEEKRLQELMLSRPNSPMLGSSSLPLQEDESPMPAFSAAMGRLPQMQSDSITPDPAMPFRMATRIAAFIRYNLLPLVILLSLRAARGLAYLAASLVPLLSNIIDVEVRRIEIYAAEQDVVVRLSHIRLGAQMDIMRQATKESNVKDVKEADCDSLRRRMSMLLFMPARLGSSARDAASLVVDGLPAVHANLRILTDGLQVFDAAQAREAVRRKASGRPDSRRDNGGSQDGFKYTSPHSPTPSLSIRRMHEQEWSSFADPRIADPVTHRPPSMTRTVSTGDVMRRSRSKDGHLDSRSRWTGRWTDWALEARPNASFFAHTNWYGDIEECRDASIPSGARILATQDVNVFKLGLVLGRSVSAKESLHLSVRLAAITVGADSVLGLTERLHERKLRQQAQQSLEGSKGTSSSDDQFPQRGTPPRKLVDLVQMLGSISVALPAVYLDLSSKTSFDVINSERPFADTGTQEKSYVPSSLQVFAAMKGLSLQLKTSNLDDSMHQQFLGSCGIKNFKAAAARRGLSDGIMWTLGRRKVAYNEDRRVFAIAASISSIDLRVGIDGQSRALQSDVFQMNDLSVDMRSTWTPAGLVLAASAPEGREMRCFVSDPNEQAVVADAKIAKLCGDVKVQHLLALLVFVRHRQAERQQKLKRILVDSRAKPASLSSPQRAGGTKKQIPRFFVAFAVQDTSYRLNATSLLSDDDKLSKMSATSDLSLMVDIPNVRVNVSGEYRDQYVRRSESERKAAWKSLAKDELEWSLSSSTSSATTGPNADFTDQQQSSGNSVPNQISGDYLDWKKHALSEGSQSPEAYDESNDSRTSAAPLTMTEALKQMRELQARQEAGKGAPVRSRNHLPKRRSSRKSTNGLPSAVGLDTHTLKSEARCSCELVNVYWAMDGDDISSQRRAKNGGRRDPPVSSRLASHVRTHRHILGLHNFDLSANLGITARQDVATNIVTLHSEGSTADLCGSIGELDIDMWHSTSLDATRILLQAIEKTKKKVDSASDYEPLVDDKLGENKHRHSNDEDMMQERPPPLLDVLVHGTSAYFSLGSFIAHIGGTDEACDHNLSRGLGIEMKHVMAQMAVARMEPRRVLDPFHYSLSARSALDLAEDQRATVAALAVRHGRAAGAKLSIYNLNVFPLLDAEIATAQHVDGQDANKATSRADEASESHLMSPSLYAPALWDFQQTKPFRTSTHNQRAKFRQQDRSNFMLSVPFFAVRANLLPKGSGAEKLGKRPEELIIVTEGTRLLSVKIELLQTYCILVALASMKGLIPKNEDDKRHASAVRPARKTKEQKFTKPTFHAVLSISEVHVSICLPKEVKVFLSIERIEANTNSTGEFSAGFEWLMAAVESAEVPSRGEWQVLSRIRDCRVLFERPEGSTRPKITVNTDGILLRIPFNYTVHPIIDSTVVAVKATKQLVHQFVKGGKDSIITPVAEGPKHLPYIMVRARILDIEAEDDPFETRLNIIWRSGGDENQARAERESAFEEKLRLLERVQKTTKSKSRPKGQRNMSFASTISTSASESDDEEEVQKLKRQAATPAEEARQRLHAFNASSWIRRFNNAKAEQARREESKRRRIYGRSVPTISSVHGKALPIKLAMPSRSAPLFRSMFTKVEINVGPTSFPESHLKDFLYQQGGGMPKDMEYSLLVPLNLHIRMDEWKIELRDYPMPLLHFPPINHQTQSDTLAGVELEMDCCIAEQLGTSKALRHIPAIIVPASTGRLDAIEYGISVPRMSMPTKFFGSPVISVNSSFTSRLVWGQSIQPAIHDVVRVFEGITSPPHDPSPRIGFWDKLSLLLQGTLLIRFPGDGQFHVYLKGSRDPYHILGHGAGWVKCWRDNVQLRLGFENKSREVFQIISGEYLLAIPDLKDYIDRAATGTEVQGAPTSSSAADDDEENANGHFGKKHRRRKTQPADEAPMQLVASKQRYMREPDFKKICLKLTNGVRWGFGLLLERTCTDSTCKRDPKCQGAPFYRECRFWTRKPHWEVYTRSHEYVDTLPDDERGDSYEGWRSNHLHFSISINAPAVPDDLSQPRKNSKDSSASSSKHTVNNMFFTPLAWEHFWAWMRLFDSALSLPIRQGKLFPGSLNQSPKFGRHLGTIKYRFDIAPLFITHVYPQEDKHDWARGRTTLIGIKSRVSLFHMDLHQRQQEIIIDRPEFGERRKRFHKPFYEADIDLADINFRTLVGQFQEPEKRLFPQHDFDDNDENDESNLFDDEGEEDPTRLEKDLEWHDMHDFVELDWAPPEGTGGKPPRIRLIEAMTSPRFNWYRRYESKGERKERMKRQASPNEKNKSDIEEKGREQDESHLERTKFGNEDTHTCLVGQSPNPTTVQVCLAETRLSFLEKELASHRSKYGDNEPASATFMGGETNAQKENDHVRKAAQKKETDLLKKIKLVQDYLEILRQFDGIMRDVTGDHTAQKSKVEKSDATAKIEAYGRDLIRESTSFENQFFIHNPIIFYSNATRDALLKYYFSSRKRRAVVHSLSARAVRYIRDMTSHEDDGKAKDTRTERLNSSQSVNPGSTPQTSVDSKNVSKQPTRQSSFDGTPDNLRSAPDNIFDELLKPFLHGRQQENLMNDLGQSKMSESISQFDPHDGISDDFEVRSSNICIILKPQIILRSHVSDSSTVIITATRARLQNYSVIDPRVEEDSVNERVLYRNAMGVDALQAFHPAKGCTFNDRAKERNGFVYVPLETLVDLRHETSDFDRIAPRTDATIQYDKFNRLRMGDNAHPVARANAQSSSDASHNDHLLYAMDLIRVRCPRYTIMANADQFGAIYNVVTDLILYRDPAYREHSKKLDMVMFNYDLSDVKTMADIVQEMQIRIRHARELHSQYQLHFQLLNERGRLDFLGLKAEIYDMQVDLNLLLEAMTLAADHSGKDAEKKSALRLDARADYISWNMMGLEEGELLAKMSLRGASFNWLNKADNSVVNSLTLVDLNAVNVDQNAVFQEIITKYHNVEGHPMKERGMLFDASWSVLAPVGGIAMIDRFNLELHPLRIQVEHKVGKQIEEYIFGSMREKRREEQEHQHQLAQQRHSARDSIDAEDGRNGNRRRTMSMRLRRIKEVFQHHGSHHNGDEKDNGSVHEYKTDSSAPSSPRKASKPLPPSRRSMDGRKSMTLHRVSSRKSVLSPEDAKSGRSSTYMGSSTASSTLGSQTMGGSSSALNSGDDSGVGAANGHADLDSEDENFQRAIAVRNATEMRERASRNVTFVSVKVAPTILCLSYKGEKQKSIMDLYDLVFRTPKLEYRNRTWTNADLASHFKRDIIKAAWKQRSTLIKGVISHKRPPATQRVAQAALTLATRSRPSPAPSLATRSHSPALDERKGMMRGILNGVTGREPAAEEEATRSPSPPQAAPPLASEDYDKANVRSDTPEFRFHIDPPSFSTSGSQSSMSPNHTLHPVPSPSSQTTAGAASRRRAEPLERRKNEPIVFNEADDEDDANGLNRSRSDSDELSDGGSFDDYREDLDDLEEEEDDVVEEGASYPRATRHPNELSDVKEEAESPTEERENTFSSRFRLGADMSRFSSKSSGGSQNASSSAVPASTVGGNLKHPKLGRLLAKTLHKRRTEVSPAAAPSPTESPSKATSSSPSKRSHSLEGVEASDN